MSLRRHSGSPALHVPLAACLLVLSSAYAVAQATPQATPAPTPAPASSLPSVPVPQPVAGYQDPLQKPLVVAPGPAQPVIITQPTTAASLPSMPAYDFEEARPGPDRLGSTYIPVDSTIYPMALRLYSLGYLDTAFINMRPWTRRSLLHMLQASQADIMASGDDQAIDILAKLNQYVADEAPGNNLTRGTVYGVNTLYTRVLGISGPTLRDSYHLGQTINNDYGRPYQTGFNNITGFSTVNEMGWFSLYVRGEYQHSPSATGYSTALATELSNIDEIQYSGFNLNQATIPAGPIAAQNPFRLQEATLSVHLFGHEISGGKSDAWLGPSLGGSMAWSNNAENIYSFRINRIEPLHIPLLSYVLGPLRYDFFVGSLKGHTFPNSPWVHSEMFSFQPSSNFEFGFQRTVIWGGEGHVPVTIHTFLRSFFSLDDTEGDPASKNTSADPGARYSVFNFSYRLPFVRKYATLTLDSIAHDDVTPPSAPRRAAYRPGVYISQIPGLRKLDFRVEASNTDTSTSRSINGSFNYFETVQRQGYTNKGFIMGDWVGREAKAGQSWLTYHLSGNEWVQAEYLYKKTPYDFIPGGTTQQEFKIEVVKRIHKDFELDAWLQHEGWKAPIYLPGQQNNTAIAFQVTYFPKLRTGPAPFSK